MIIILLFILKFILFYKFTNVSINYASVLAMDLLVVSFFYYIANFDKTGKKRLYLWFYIIVSIIMFVDITYFDYFNRMPVIRELNHAGNLGDVSDAVFMLIDFKKLIFILDLPFVIYFGLKNRLYTIENIFLKKHKLKSYTIPIYIILICAMILLFNNNNFNAIKRLSLFSYHANDIFSKGKTQIAEGKESHEILKEGEKNEYTGIAKGKNLIIIQVESLNNFPINKKYNGIEVTPNLNKLINEKGSIYFNNYFELLGAGNTSDAEFVTLHSLYPSMKNPSYEVYLNSDLYGLPKILKEYGYNVAAYHGYKPEFWIRDRAYPHIGIDKFYSEGYYDKDDVIGMGVSDKSFFKKSAELIKEYQSEPFFSFLITLSNHVPFEMPEKDKKLKLKPEDEGNLFGRYLSSVHYTDEAIGEFLKELKEKGLYDNSMIAIYGDHHGILMKDKVVNDKISDFIGADFDYDTMLNIPLIIHVGGYAGKAKIDKVGSHLDFLPTILNLYGIDRKHYVLLGEDMLNGKDDGVVFPQSYLIRGSFINKDYIFKMKRDGIFENGELINRHTRKIEDNKKAKELYKKAIEDIDYSKYICENNLVSSIMDSGETDKKVEVANKAELENAVEIKDINEFQSAYKKGFRIFKTKLFKSTDGLYTTSSEEKSFEEIKNADYNILTLGEIAGLLSNVKFILSADDMKELADFIRKMPGLQRNLILEARDHETFEYIGTRQNGYNIMVSGDEFSEEEKLSLHENIPELIFDNSTSEELLKVSFYKDKEPKIFEFDEVKDFEDKSDAYKDFKTNNIVVDEVLMTKYDYENNIVDLSSSEFSSVEKLKKYMDKHKEKIVAIFPDEQSIETLRYLKENEIDLDRILILLKSYEEAPYAYKLGAKMVSYSYYHPLVEEYIYLSNGYFWKNK
ncbi:MAG: LTA synthase family protein [Ezakiella sp.]|nr:LTA synthase family protein [Ezakiella sp.]MDD7471338.1 LTA synthase family protein [Bacillota bacterium]MDY3923567.1 LTA synthase family protein [Ezakiella sp.]